MTSPLFANLGGLIGLARHGVDIKPTLLRVLTDLYVQRPTHSTAEERQYVELALRLVDAVDAGTRRAVADRLAAYPSAPAELVHRLANDIHPGAAAEVTAGAPDVVAPAGNAGQEIAERFFAADSDGRKALLSDLGDIDATPPANAQTINRNLEAAVLGGRPGDFIRQLEQALAIARPVAERIVNDVSGEPLVVAAKALAMPIDMLQRILLFVNPAIGQSVRRVYALSALYGEIRTNAALHLVACWRGLDAPTVEKRAARSFPRSGRGEPAPRADAARPQRPEDAASAHDIEKVAS